MPTKYVVITPVRDEEEYLPLTVESMLRQTIRPVEYVIVDDGSKDRTGEIIDDYARKYSWIRAVHRKDRGFRKWGAGIIEAFYEGFNALTCKDWDFMCKLDGDLSFEPNYFEAMFDKFAESPKLGIAGGFLYHSENGQKTLEGHPTFHVRGGTKVYKKACWEALGGLWVGPGSDTLDEVKANMLGWKSMSFHDLQVNHHRWTGAAYGKWGGIVKNGKTDYVSGYHPLFLFAKAFARLRQRPYILGALALLYGYVSAYFQRIPQVDDPKLIRYLQGQQLAKLSGRETIWK
ncbi:MAG TPA: glycosyltransferase family 2 protein [Terriglobales bacterium]|nr:glycosyltransferase family 2 protein [Terriglobales bacterium]